MQANEIKKLCKENPDKIVELINALIESNIKLLNRVKELENRLNKDSNNSNKPPSGDNIRSKLNRKTKKRKKKRKHGGQKGHKGSTLKAVSEPDHIQTHELNTCSKCNHSLEDVNSKGYDKRQEFDIPPIVIEVIEHRAEIKICPCCGEEIKADFPNDITQKTQYGKRIKALAVYLNQYQLIPYKRTAEFFKDILNHTISQGTINNFIRFAHNNLDDFENKIKECLINAKIVNFDETGTFINKMLNWMHVASTPNLTFYGLHKNRGYDAMVDIGILSNFKGTAMHDFFRSYLKFNNCSHIFCNSHIFRELTEIHENYKEKWALELGKLLLEIKTKVNTVRDINKNKKLNKYFLKKFEKLYDQILKKGFRKNPWKPKKNNQRGRPAQTKARNLLDRLRNNKSVVLAFMYDFKMPFTNNLAERDFRMVKVHQKISNCFRSERGGKYFCRIRSYISTLKKNHCSVIQEIENIFEKKSYIPDFIAE